jgi:hypothetical protein
MIGSIGLAQIAEKPRKRPVIRVLAGARDPHPDDEGNATPRIEDGKLRGFFPRFPAIGIDADPLCSAQVKNRVTR